MKPHDGGQPHDRPRLQRVPPHDLTVEANLLGAALINPQIARLVAATPPTTFYSGNHQTIADILGELALKDWPTDTGTVAAHLRVRGQLDTIGGYQALTALMADTPRADPNTATHWIRLLEEHAAKRQLLHLLGETVEAVYRNIPTGGLVEAMGHTAAAVDQHVVSTYEPVNLARILAGDDPTDPPNILPRTDGACLIYPGKVHAINSEPECGKSWLALHACLTEIDQGRHVVYIDFEDSPGEIVARLLNLGATVEHILEQFHYVRPDDSLTPQAVTKLVALTEHHQATLCVADGVTEAMSLAGLSIKDNDDIARFYALLPRPLARTGTAVLLLDHLVKNKDDQGRWGIGGQHKLAGIDGVVYKYERITPFAPGQPGASRLTVSKDRAGLVRANATGTNQTAAIVHYRPTPDGLQVDVDPGDSTTGWTGPSHCQDAILELLSGMPGEEYSVNKIVEKLQIRGNSYRKTTVSVAAELLVDSRQLEVRDGPRNSRLYRWETDERVQDELY